MRVRITAEHQGHVGLPPDVHSRVLMWIREELQGKELFGSGSGGPDEPVDLKTVLRWFSSIRCQTLPVTIDRTIKGGRVTFQAHWLEATALVYYLI